jgi:type I restriction enzyme S subunit
MEVKPGYRQTEVGVIPEEWEVRRLGECATFRTGPFGSALHKSDYANDGVPVINPMHIVDGRIEPTRSMTITDSAAKNLSDFRMKAGEIVIGRRGDMGRCAVIQAHQAGWLCGTGSMIVRCEKAADVDFVRRVLSSPQVIAAIEDTAVGTTMVNLNQGALAGLRVPLPPLPEQRAVATTLDDVDALLGALERLITKKRELKQAAMQQLLTGKTRLPGFIGDWEMKRIEEFADCTAGGTPSTKIPEYWGGSIRWMSSGELNLKQIYEAEGRITEAGLNNSSAQMIPEKCVLIGLAGQGKTRGTVAISFVDLCTNQSIAAILPNTGFSPEYLYYNLDSRYDELRELSAGGGGRGGLNLRLIKGIPIPFPLLVEQTAIAAVLTDIDAEVTALEQRLAKTRALKQGMMQELLTGRTRLISPQEAHA